MRCYTTDWQVNGKPVSLSGDLMDMATILPRITLLLIGADACTPHIINQVWGADETARLALGGPRGDLSLIRRRILTHQKVAINTVHIWLTNPSTPVLPKTLESFKLLPRTLQQLLLDCSHKWVFAREPVPSGTSTAQRLLDNLRDYIIPDTQSFEEKAIRWYSDLLLGQRADDQTGFDNAIIVAYGMCPPITLQEFYERDPDLPRPSYFMRGTSDKIWGEDTHGVMRTTAENWTDDCEGPTYE